MKVAFLTSLVLAEAQRGCDMQTVFADIHDGDEKEVTIKGTAMTIKPHGNDQEWVVNTEIDCATGKAIVDLNVTGKADHPPVPITATLFTSISLHPKRKKTTFVYTDPSGTLVDDPTFPLNQWVALEAEVQGLPGIRCPDKFTAVFADMHDGDQKAVTIDGEAMTIKPHGNDQEWTVNAVLDRESCSASVDFNVPGKADHPPVPITATYWFEYVPPHRGGWENTFEFTDPSGTLAGAGFPLNRWVQLADKTIWT